MRAACPAMTKCNRQCLYGVVAEHDLRVHCAQVQDRVISSHVRIGSRVLVSENQTSSSLNPGYTLDSC